MIEVGSYVWHKRYRDSVWQVDKIRARGSQYPRSPEDLIVRLVARLDRTKRWIGTKTRVVSPVDVERVPDMLAIAAIAAEDSA